jgi:hypothetical protein
MGNWEVVEINCGAVSARSEECIDIAEDFDVVKVVCEGEAWRW